MAYTRYSIMLSCVTVVQDRHIVPIKVKQEVLSAVSNGDIASDP